MTVENPDILRLLKALAHESRLRLLGLLAQGPHSVQQLAAAVSISEPTASHHLAMLRDIGLVSRKVDGNTHWYGFEGDALKRLARTFLNREALAHLAGTPRVRGTPEAIVAIYLNADGTLKEIPATRKKRHAVLGWLVRQFDESRRYPESEVNALLKARHPDCATLRREFIINRMMAREGGVYWRLPEGDWAQADGQYPKD